MTLISPLRWLGLGLALGSSALAAPPSTPLDPTALGGLAHLWRGEGDGADALGGESLTVSPRISVVPGVRGQALRLPGIAGVVADNSRPPLSGFSPSFTTTLWVKPEAGRVATPETIRGLAGLSGQQYVLFPAHGGFGLVGGAGLGLSVGTNGVTVAEHRDAHLPTPLVWNGDLHGWVHLAVVYDRHVPSLYVNGVHVHTGLDTRLRDTISPGNIYPSKTLGSPADYGAFQGAVDEVALFSRALDAAEIARLAGLPDPAPPALPKLLNLNFGTDHTPARVGPAAFGLGSQDAWNLYSRDDGRGGFRNQGGLDNLLWSDGTPSGVSLQVFNAPGAWSNGHPDGMFGIYLYPLGGSQVVVDLQQLPGGRYTLYAYGHGGPPDNQNTVFNLRASGVDYGDRATAADASWRSTQWMEGAHYVRFTNVFVGPGQTMTLTAKPGAYPQASINGLQLVQESAESLLFLPAPGWFTHHVDVTLLGGGGSLDVRYTLDGSEPSAASPAYQSPVRLTAAATVRARLFEGATPRSPIVTAEYLRLYAIDDGLPAAWREQYFGPGYRTDPRVAADADPDLDGASNLQEFGNGTHPLDPLSGFGVAVRAVPSITWNSSPGVVYRVLRKDRLTDLQWTEVTRVAATSDRTRFTDTDVADLPRYYLIEAVRP